jgi:NADPH:quinone reductase-like Zn-dependent oxidoreductase
VKAVLYDEAGGPEVLRHVDVPDPEPGRRDVVVEVAACAVNRLDVVQRKGWFQMPGFTYPHIAGMDLAGEIVGVGTDVEEWRPGDRVVVDPSLAGVPDGSKLAGRGDIYGSLGVIGATVDGGYAERCLVPASHVYRVPDGMALREAATFPTSYLTASHALFEIGGLHAGETVMVHAAGSGVSIAAIQLAARAGATVLATAGTEERCAKAIALGATAACTNRGTDVAAWARAATDGRGVDMVLDHVGTALFEASLHSLAVRGRLVSCGNTTGDQAAIPSLGYLYHFGLRIMGSDGYRPDEFGPVWRTFCDGGFTIVVDSEFALADAAAAQEKLLTTGAFGKILLVP